MLPFRGSYVLGPTCLLSLCLAACATTTIHSQVDPQASRHTYRKIAVVVAVADFALQQEAERMIQAKTAGRSTTVVPWHTLFFGGREYSQEEKAQILADARIEAVLVVLPTGAGSVSAYIPKTTTSSGTLEVDDDSASGSISTTNRGGYTVSAPTGQFRADLRDLTTRRSVWMAVMSTGPSDAMSTAYGGITWRDIYKSMAGKTANQLIRDGVVR